MALVILVDRLDLDIILTIFSQEIEKPIVGPVILI